MQPYWQCGWCGGKIPSGSRFCTHCGADLNQPPPAAPPGAKVVIPSQGSIQSDFRYGHSPMLAAILSVFFCTFGGTIYNRQYLKATVMTLIAMVCAVLTGGASLWITWPAFILDSALIAGRLQRGETVGQWQFF